MRSRLRLLGAAVVAAAALGAGVTSPAPAGAAPTHVAIVVAGIGAPQCVPWTNGMTGSDVLADAGFTVKYGQQPPYQGFVLTIGRAKDGIAPKGTDHPDNEHYWSYWKDSGSGWVYSGSGAPFSKVTAGTVEGWSYVDGQPQASPPPAASYASICAGKDLSSAPSSAPSRPATSTAGPARPAPPPASASAPSPVRAGGDPSHSATVGGAAAGPSPTRRPAESAASTSSAASRTVPDASPAASASSMPVPSTADTGSTGGGLAPWGSAVGIAGVAALAAGAFWLNRRRGQDAP